MSLPSTMKAVVIGNSKPAIKDDLPLPNLPKGYMLLKTLAVAGNPSDWKHCTYNWGPAGAIIGVDVAGEIVKLGEGVEDFKIGEKVYSFVHAASHETPGNGTFAKYVAVDSKLSFKTIPDIKISGKDSLPEGGVKTLEGAASIPCSWLTAGATLFHHMKLNLTWEPKDVQIERPVLIWGGATALGQSIIQLLKKVNGCSKIVVVASKKHEAQLKTYGADELFDYHDADVIDQIKAKYDNFAYLLDCVSTPSTFNQVYQCGSSKYESTIIGYNVLTIDDIEPQYRNDKIKVDGVIIYAALGLEFKLGEFFFPADQEYRETVIKFIKFVNPYLNDGSLHHVPIKVYKNGFESLLEILSDIKEGRNSGEKLVATF